MTEEPRGESSPSRGTVAEVGLAFLKLGLTSFGGPVAHLGYFREELVVRRKWLDDTTYGDIVALCQFLPGPASSQVVFALGMRRAGLAGALAGSLAFTLPSALAMIAFAYGAADLRRVLGSGFLHGLKLAAVVVVAQAVWGMGKKLCTDRARLTITLMSAAVLLARPSAVTQIAVLVGAALVGYRLFRAETKAAPAAPPSRAPRAAIAALVLALGLLAVLPALASWTGLRQVAMVDAFYRSGSLVFGGGHVVLPLLRAETVPRGWLTDARFLEGYAGAQAVPGPLFTFAAFLGTAMNPGPYAWTSGLLGLAAIFLPAWLLVGGALPFWERLREAPWAKASLAGANAGVVGVLLAALYTPVVTEGITGRVDVALVLLAFGALESWKAPPWLVVSGLAVVGALVH